jgi:hypothetical protein
MPASLRSLLADAFYVMNWIFKPIFYIFAMAIPPFAVVALLEALGPLIGFSKETQSFSIRNPTFPMQL